MSALLALFHRAGDPLDPTRVEAGLAARPEFAVHGRRIWQTGSVAMAHQHFWVTPEDVGEQQPLVEQRAGITARVIACDARLDNRAELAARLGISPGHERSDAALISLAYERWGSDLPAHLLGEFAIAIWDAEARGLFAARDPMGERGLSYALDGQRFILATEVGQVIASRAAGARLDETMIARYLASVWDDPEPTYFEGVRHLSPGHALWVTQSQFRTWAYWRPDPTRRIHHRRDEDYAEHFRDVFRRAVTCRVRSAAHVGVALSGGLDSSSVAAVAAPAAGRLHSFTCAFDEFSACDERRWARLVEERCGLDASIVRGDALWTLSRVDEWPAHRDFVSFDAFAALPLAVAAAAAAKDCRVLLGGGFGDVLFGGVSRPAGRLRGLVRRLRRLRRIDASDAHPGLTPRFAERSGVLESLRRLRDSDDHDSLGQAHAAAMFMSLYPLARAASRSDDHRLRVSRAEPFRDLRLVEFMLALPPSQIWREGETKRVLRNAMRGLLPERIRLRPEKVDFTPLFTAGLLHRERGAVEWLLTRPLIVDHGWVRADWLRREWHVAQQGAWSQGGYDLWLCLCLELWVRRRAGMACPRGPSRQGAEHGADEPIGDSRST